MRLRFERARAEGDLPSNSSPADLAHFVATLSQGLSVQSAGGAKRAELLRVVDMSLRAWPA